MGKIRAISEEKAWNKIYIIKWSGNLEGGILHLPKCLIGKRVKLVEIK